MTVVQIEVKPTCICMPTTLYQIGVARPTELIWSLESDITTRIVNHIHVFWILNGFTNLASEFCIQWSSKIYAVGTYAQLFADGLDLCGGSFNMSQKICSCTGSIKKILETPSVPKDSRQGGRTWQAFGGGKNGHETFRQASIYNFRDKCVVFARNLKFSNLTQ